MNVLEKILEEIEDLNYYPEGMGCGIEDCGITDRYEACEYGWNKAIEAVTEVIESMNGMISPPLSQGKEIYWQNEACTLRCGTFKPREGTKEQFILWEMEKYDFSEKQQK